MFRSGEWEVTCKLRELESEYDGTPCVAIALELECSGDLPERERGEGGGGRRGGRQLKPGVPGPLPLETSFDLDARGLLYISLDAGRPLALELEGEFTIDSERTRSRGDSEMTISTSQRGSFTHTVALSTVTAEDE